MGGTSSQCCGDYRRQTPLLLPSLLMKNHFIQHTPREQQGFELPLACNCKAARPMSTDGKTHPKGRHHTAERVELCCWNYFGRRCLFYGKKEKMSLFFMSLIVELFSDFHNAEWNLQVSLTYLSSESERNTKYHRLQGQWESLAVTALEMKRRTRLFNPCDSPLRMTFTFIACLTDTVKICSYNRLDYSFFFQINSLLSWT